MDSESQGTLLCGTGVAAAGAMLCEQSLLTFCLILSKAPVRRELQQGGSMHSCQVWRNVGPCHAVVDSPQRRLGVPTDLQDQRAKGQEPDHAWLS